MERPGLIDSRNRRGATLVGVGFGNWWGAIAEKWNPSRNAFRRRKLQFDLVRKDCGLKINRQRQ